MKKLIFPLLLAIFVSLGIAVSAAPPIPPSDPSSGGGGNPGPVGAPIDGGLGILLVMGAAYGGKKLYMARKKKQNDKKEKEILQNGL